MARGQSILVVKLSAIGDVIMCTAAVRALRRHMPDARITWVVEPKSAGVLEGNPDVDEVIVWRRESLREFIQLFRKLRRRKFDICLDFQGLARSALVTLVSGAKRKIGYADGREKSNYAYNEHFDCPERPHGMRCYLRLLSMIGVEFDDQDGDMRLSATDDELAKIDDVLSGLGVAPEEKIAALVPATSREYKHWREQGWAEVADKLWDEMGLRGVFLGAKADVPLVERILSQTKSPAVGAAGLTSLKLSTVIVARSEVVVAVDTGLMHAGVAHGKPTVGLFTNTSAWRNHIHRPNFRMLRKDYECVPCNKTQICDNWNCINDITSDDVIEAVRLLTSRGVLEETSS